MALARAEVDVAQAKGAISTRKIVVDEYKSIFQSLKQQAGGVFDALFTKSQSVWSAIGNSLKTALLTVALAAPSGLFIS
jgi:ABC-type Fe3+ transport system permease subunit